MLSLKYPGMAFVLTELMWPQFNDAVDLMWRADNVYIDTSWLHMRGALEFVRDEFGSGRMLFGAGYKSHYGASVAALAHAEITEEDRRRIFSANLEALLGIDAGPEKLACEPAIISEKPLWSRFRDGMPVEGPEIIDAHAHTGPHTRGWILRDIEPGENIANLISQMDSCGVNKTVIVPESGLFSEPAQGNFEIEKMMGEHLDRFMGYFAFNPWYAERLAGVLDEFFSREFFIGFKILPSYWKVPVDDPRYEPVWEYAHVHRLPILIHTWDDRYNSPRMLEKIATAYPCAFFLLGHSGGGTSGRAEAVVLGRANANVYLEFCGSFTTPADWVGTISEAGIGKVIFGSDTGAHSLAWELGRFLSIPLPDEALRPALAENFKNILRQRSPGGSAPRPG